MVEYGILVWTLEDPSKVNECALAPSTEGGLIVVELWTCGVATETGGATDVGAVVKVATEVVVTVVAASELQVLKC